MPVISNTIVTTDLAPAISIDHANRLVEDINKFREMLGIADMKVVPAGSTVTVYNVARYGDAPEQVAEGIEIPLTKIQRTGANITIGLKKYRDLVTAEAIQKVGRDVAINDTDTGLVNEARAGIKSAFFGTITGTEAVSDGGETMQSAAADVWGDVVTHFDGKDVSTIFFVNPADAAVYLGNTTVNLADAFGLSYIENWFGMGTLVISPAITQGYIFGTAKENLNGVYSPANGDLGAAFGASSDETGLVLVSHAPMLGRASIEALVMTAATFYAEDASGVFKGAIGAQGATGATGA